MPLPDRREDVLNIAAEVFARKGIASTTMRDLGQAARLHPGSLYHYFESKNMLVHTILERLINDLADRLNALHVHQLAPLTAMRAMIAEVLRIIADHPHATVMFQDDRRYLRDQGLMQPSDPRADAVRALWLQTLHRGIESGVFRQDIDQQVIYRTIRDALWATVRWPNRDSFSTEEFADVMTALLLTGVLAKNHQP